MKRLLLVAALLFAVVATATVGGASGALEQEAIDPDDVQLSIAVEADGDARWRIEYRRLLETESDENAFEEFQADLDANRSRYRERFHNRMNATAEAASDATGREMAIRNVSVRAQRENLPRSYGVVTYSFTWTNFARVDGDRLVVGDAIDGLFLDNRSTMLVSWPDGYSVVEATPAPGETRPTAVVWTGPTNFADGEPRVRLAPSEAVDGDGNQLLGVGVWWLLVAGVILVVVSLAAVGVGARIGIGPFDGGTTEAESAGEADVTDTTASTDDELLPNEEQVLRLVEANGGRMKQRDVSAELDWTAAKTSQVTKRLRENGELDAFRLGRENVLELPDESDT